MSSVGAIPVTDLDSLNSKLLQAVQSRLEPYNQPFKRTLVLMLKKVHMKSSSLTNTQCFNDFYHLYAQLRALFI
jgi:hypothetical protein